MSVLETVENKNDENLLRRIRGFDFFFACEASFHGSFAGSIREAQLTGEVQMTKTREGTRALKSQIGQSSRKFVMWLKKNITQGQRIMKLADSCEICVSALEETKNSKPGYKAEKLKKKSEKSDTYGQKLNSGERSLNRTLCTILTWAPTVLWHLQMNLAQLT